MKKYVCDCCKAEVAATVVCSIQVEAENEAAEELDYDDQFDLCNDCYKKILTALKGFNLKSR